MKKILIMGLPGAGKTFLASEVKKQLQENGYTVDWFNADVIRQQNDDWDFSSEGRVRQSVRMKELAKKSTADYVICDFVAPLIEMRTNFAADWTIWVDTITESRYEDTNNAFISPTTYDFKITEQDAVKWSKFIVEHIFAKKKITDESIIRSLVKAVSWRITGTLSIFAISYIVAGDILISSTIASIQLVWNTMLYIIHERVWNRVTWGK